MISALAWVPKGAPQQTPDRFNLDEAEYERIAAEIGVQVESAREDMMLAMAGNQMNGAEEAEEEMGDDVDAGDDKEEEKEQSEAVKAAKAVAAAAKSGDDNSELAIYNLDDYDNEDDQGKNFPIFRNVHGLKYHSSNTEDPYIEVGDDVDLQEELEQMMVAPTDNLLVACKTEDDVSHLEVYLYEEEEDNLFMHHDIMLPSFPLCVEWMDYKVGKKAAEAAATATGQVGHGNYVAIGTFEPEIEIWNLDVVDAVYPELILGAQPATVDESSSSNSKNKKKKKKKQQMSKGMKNRSNTPHPQYHTGAISALSWNKSHRNLLLSASTDSTVKLWDLNAGLTSSSSTSSSTCIAAVKSYNHHKDKVAVVAWNPAEPTVFLSGGYDQGGRVCALDSRAPDQVASWTLGSDVECVKWDSFRPERILVSTENGLVRCFDGRMASKSSSAPLYTIHAHDAAVSALDMSPHIDGLLVTGGADRMVKVWDVREGKNKSCVVSRDLGVGKVFAANFSADTPYVLAASGSKGKVVIWNLESNMGVRKVFRDAVPRPANNPYLAAALEAHGEGAEPVSMQQAAPGAGEGAEGKKEVTTLESDAESDEEEGEEEKMAGMAAGMGMDEDDEDNEEEGGMDMD